jgi:hypothetical protein
MNTDPSRLDLVIFCDQRRDSFDPMEDNEWEFSRECAIYWFCSLWHGGQSSEIYSTLSTSEYRPGCSETLESLEDNDYAAFELFGEMEANFFPEPVSR